MSNWEKIGGIIFAALAALVASWMVGTHFGLNKESWPGWVQAIGSIAAIIGAYWIGERQANAAAKTAAQQRIEADQKKRAAYLAIATSANNYVVQIRKYFGGTATNKLGMLMNYDENIGEHFIEALNAVPVYELGSPAAVQAWISTKNAFVYFHKAIVYYVDNINEDVGGSDETRAGNPRRVKQCGGYMTTCYSELATALRAD